MKSLTWLIGFSVFMAIASIGCGPRPTRPFLAEQFFGGEHQLQKLMPFVSQESHISGGGAFFLFVGVGSVSGSSNTRYEVKFAWKSNLDDTYIISSFPLEKVRVRFDDKNESPTVRFKLNCDNQGCGGDWALRNGWGQQYTIDHGDIEYAVITVKQKDWPVKIQMPMQ